MSVALEINPELLITTNAVGKNNSDYSYRLDTGIQDFNRIVSSDELETLKFSHIPITGFDKFFYFKDLQELKTATKQFADGVECDFTKLKDYTNEEDEHGKPKPIVAVFGAIDIQLNTGSTCHLARPVYQVHRHKKDGSVPNINDVQQYISETWLEECKEALFHSGDSAGERFGVIKSLKQSERFQLKLLKIALGFLISFIVIIVILVFFTFFKEEQSQAVVNNQASQSASTQHNNNGRVVLPSTTSIHPANAVYGGGFAGQEGHGSVEDFAQLQVEQTQQMLKQMGVDVNDNGQNLGCFVQQQK